MKLYDLRRMSVIVFLASLISTAWGQPGIFTVQVGSAPLPSIPLVNHGDSWHYRKGTNQPQSDWKTVSAGSLDATWLTGPGGFGYEDNDDATVLSDMLNNYSTVYIRQTFAISPSVDTNRHVRLTMDWDDGFVAWVDGSEVARSPNAPGAQGTEPPYSAISLAPNHEASAGQGGNPPTTYDLGPVGALLQPGTHVLGILGLNGATNSTDFSLIADLDLASAGSGGTTSGGYFQLVPGSSVELTGTNTIPDSARVVVNGKDAVFNIAAGTWSKTQTLAPGVNRLFIAALDSSGAILASITQDVVSEVASTSIGGTLSLNTDWNPGMGIIRVTNNVVVSSGATLSIAPGTVVLVPANLSIIATNLSSVQAIGSSNSPIYFLPSDGTNAWRELSALGVNSTVTLRHIESVAGQVRSVNGGTVLIEDSFLHDSFAREIVAGVSGTNLTLRRTHIKNFVEVDSRDTPVLVEDCLLEHTRVDALDIKTPVIPAPLIVRRSTLRHGVVVSGEPDADAVDLGPGAAVVENCLIHSFDDKGVSIGGNASGTIVRNSLIYNCGLAGISAYSSTNCIVSQNTISLCSTGLWLRNNPGPAFVMGTNNIVWGNNLETGVFNTSVLTLSYSDVQGGFAGTGNISADPLFVSASAHDFHVSGASPTLGTGFNGSNMGVPFPVGGIPPAPFNLAAVTLSANQVQLRWQEDADNESGFWIDSSPDGIQWQREIEPGPNVTNVTVTLANRPYFRVKAQNPSGESPWSNMAIAPTQTSPVSETFVGGTLTNHTTWTTNMGMIIVRSNLIVPTNIVLTILEGAVVKLTNNVGIRAIGGGVINILGSSSNKVSISSWSGTNLWTELSAQFAGASLTIRHADITGGQVTVYSNAVALLEDSYIHHYRLLSGGTLFTAPILLTHYAGPVTVRRCHFQEYHETLLRHTLLLVEDCLFEDIHGDGLDFDAALQGTILRRSTFRNGVSGNVDAVDVGNDGSQGCTNILIESCLMYNFPLDKGISIGDLNTSHGIIVSNCLMYDCNAGVAVKDECEAAIYHCTIVDCGAGFTNYYKPNISAPTGGGRTTNSYNNILWGNDRAVVVLNDGLIVADHTDFGNTNWPGVGNIDADPLFLNSAQRDYRLATNSPCIGTGRNGANMGVIFPVGGVPAAPLNLQVTFVSTTEKLLSWQDVSGNESGFVIERSTNGVQWSPGGNAPANVTNASVSGLLAGQNYFFRIRATNFIGESFNSNIASSGANPDDRDGDGMPNDWEVANMFNPDNSSDASDDADHDGATNLQEYQAGTDPHNAASRLRLELTSFMSPGQVELQFTAVSNKTYTVQFRDSLTGGIWQTLIDVPSDFSTRSFTITDSVPPGTGTRFYRVVSPQQ